MGVIVVLVWQSMSATTYERKQKETCEELLARREAQIQALTIEKEKLELWLMGAGTRTNVHIGANAHVGQVSAGHDNTQEKAQ